MSGKGSLYQRVAGREIMGKLTVEDVRKQTGMTDRIILHAKSCFVQRYGKTGEQEELNVEFVEFPGKALRLNKTQAAALLALTGKKLLPDTFNEDTEEFEDWDVTRPPVPMFVRENTFVDRQTGVETTAEKLYPVSPLSYDKALREYPTANGVKAGGKRRSK